MMNLKKPIRLTALLFCALCALAVKSVLAQAPEPAAAAENSFLTLYRNYDNARYAVQWQPTASQLFELQAKMPRYQYLVFFTTEALIQNAQSPSMRLGFFKSQAEAQNFATEQRGMFPGLSVIAVTREEHAVLFSDSASATEANYWLSPGDGMNTKALHALFNRAKNHYANKQYQQALMLYRLLSISADLETAVWAQELAGLCYERLGQSALATQSYRSLLAEHDTGSWVVRVSQRLRALETAADDGKNALRKSKYEEQSEDYYYRGVVGQTYNYMSQGGKYLAEVDTLSALATYFDLTAGTQWQGHEFEVRLNGYDVMDLLDQGDAAKTRIKRFYLDYTHSATGLKLIGGRQKDDTAGVYSYFDGATIQYPWNKKLTIGAKAGVPVHFSDFYDTLDHKFISFYGSYQWNDSWSTAGYLTQQTLYSETDRSAYGGNLQYSSDKLVSLLNFDFDYEFAELNILRWNGTYQLTKSSRLTANYGRQRSPFLTATNVKLGQPYLNVEEYLRDEFNRKYLLGDALQRTSLYEYASIAYYHKVDEKLSITTDLYQSVSSDMPIFESDDGWITSDVSFNGAEYRYTSFGVLAVALDFFGRNDAATLSFRHGDTTLATTNTVQFSERLKFGSTFYVNPKLGLRQSKNKSADTSQTRIRASLAGVYKPWRNTELRLEIGNEVIQDLEAKNSVDNTFLYAGYQTRF